MKDEISKIRENLKHYVEESGLSLGEISRLTAGVVTKSSLQRYVKGTTQKIPMESVAAIEKALKLETGTIMGWTDKQPIPSNLIPLRKVRYVPVIGRIACGTPVLAEENIVDRILLPDHIKADFALQTFGDSMTGAQIDDQDYVYIRSQPEVENGEIAAVLIGEEATLKKVYREADKLTLMPANPKHEPIMFVKSELKQVRIIGKAVAVLKNLE